jgi:sigma-B regulation protein RsbU (phosphoserine phosphatase)
LEADRVLAVRRYRVLDTPAEPAFDRIAETAAQLFGVPLGAVSFVDEDRIWVKAAHGLDAGGSYPREPGFCDTTIGQDGPWVVTDAADDPACSGNSFLTRFGIRFYAGVPLTTSDGHRIGTLCVLDTSPRQASAGQLDLLVSLGQLVVESLEVRRAADRETQMRRDAEELLRTLQASLTAPPPAALPEMEVASRYLAGEQGLEIGGDFIDVFRVDSNDWGILLGDVCGKGAQAATVAMLARTATRATAVHQFSPSAVLRDVNALFGSDETAAEDLYCSAIFARMELDKCGTWLTIANCGHPRPVMVRRSGRVQARAEATVPIGLFDAIEPVDDRVGLGPGDALVFYTDGITEARDPDGDFFGEDRLMAVLRRLTGAPAETIADAVIEAASTFAAGAPADDVAVLVLRVPDDAGQDPLGRVAAGTGLPVDRLRLPAYPRDTGPAGAES